MTPYLRRGGAFSFAAHVAALLAIIVALPKPKLSEQPIEETVVTVEFEPAATPVQRAPTPAPTPSPAPAPTATREPPAPDPPRPAPSAPISLPALPPAPAPPVVIPPVPMVQAPPPLPRPPAPEQISPAPVPAPPIPPIPPAAPTPRPPQQPTLAQSVKPTPPAARPAAPPQPDSRSLESTLDRLRAQLASKEPPRTPSSPPRGAAPGGGSPAGADNALLTAGVRRAIGDRLRECWIGDKNALDYDKQVVRLIILVDAGGTIRQADVAPSDASRAGGGVARAFADRARRAALDAQCAQLPLPAALKGQNHTFEITFRP